MTTRVGDGFGEPSALDGPTASGKHKPVIAAGEAASANRNREEAKFLARLQALAEDWRYSDEFIGLVVRYRWPRVYP